VKYMKVISALVLFSRWPTCLWNTWKWFQHWSYFPGDQPVCEIHESDFNNDFFKIHESNFSIGLVKYIKVISALVLFSRWPTCLWNTWKWFQHWFLWNTWKWFQHWSYFPSDQPVCEIHESDFSIGLIFQVTNPSVKYM
jgi:hypothetical protein